MNLGLKIEDKPFPQNITVNLGGRLSIWDRPKIMGVINLTPDSFYEGSRTSVNSDLFKDKVRKMILEGVDILDLGGYSTRPGASEISIIEEIDRVIPAIEWISKEFPETLISIDTFRSKVAKEAISGGAHIVNDISAAELDPEMMATVGELGVPYITMHMRGNPQTMQEQTSYEHIIQDILYYFSEKLEDCKKFGINDVIIDIGFGFAKTVDQNFYLLKHLQHFKTLGQPLLVGVSRKSMIYKTLGVAADEALNGSTALHMYSLCQGANLLRVHDVKEAKETIELYKKLYP